MRYGNTKSIREDIFSFYTSVATYESRKSYAHVVFGRSLLHRLFAALRAVALQLAAALRAPGPVPDIALQDKVWVFFSTKNQYDSLRFLGEGASNLVFVGIDPRAGSLVTEPDPFVLLPVHARLPIRHVAAYRSVVFRTLRRSPAQFFRMAHYFVLGIGLYEEFGKTIAAYRPRLIVLGNDHAVHCRAMMQAGRTAGVPTVYFQHASVTEHFPCLRVDYACLEGRDALDKYAVAGTSENTRCLLVGMPKFDRHFHHRNTSDRVRTIGIAINSTDVLSDVRSMLAEVLAACPGLSLRIRMHPADPRELAFEPSPADAARVDYSAGAKESAFEFLESVDMIVSGNSSIHLEAVLLNVYSVYCSLNPEVDVYGYVANGLVDEARTLPELIEIIRELRLHKPPNRHRAKYYYAPLDTEWDGRSGELGRQIVRNISAGLPVDGLSLPLA